MMPKQNCRIDTTEEIMDLLKLALSNLFQLVLK